ncbi:MAG: oxygen-independent coproporphyrinogen III oxidase, partial [Gammaproteobacteria bacterium]|nr:oxygen-independent coproporphyrinogen III oxidase [Gammaproteobacteria bacterium]
PVFDIDLVRTYDKTGPRYTSYPTAAQFTDDFSQVDYLQAASDSNRNAAKPLSLYFHIPFCATLCFYCACNKIVTKNKSRADEYLEYLYKEIELQSDQYDRGRPVNQLHLGGGTPTFLSAGQIEQLLKKTASHFDLSFEEQRDYSIEIDPRSVDVSVLYDLWNFGFNRLSLGIQDFDPAVQKAVHRVQSQDETLHMIAMAKRIGFQSINVDLIYGLPLQTAKSFCKTLDTIIDADPARLSVFNYAHLPEYFPPQKRINEQDLPDPGEKLEMLHQTVERLTSAGYVYIGMDHFAKPDDSLVKAMSSQSLHRNFQGYASHGDSDLVGMGVTAISKVANCYSQNAKFLGDYYRSLSQNTLPVTRGVTLGVEDMIRRNIIESLMCYGEVDFFEIERRYKINFKNHFSRELHELAKMQSDGLITIFPDRVSVQPAGRFLIRNVSMVFDAYQRNADRAPRHSRLI